MQVSPNGDHTLGSENEDAEPGELGSLVQGPPEYLTLVPRHITLPPLQDFV